MATLKQRLVGIRDERDIHANTATRIGQAMVDLLEHDDEGNYIRNDRDDTTEHHLTIGGGITVGSQGNVDISPEGDVNAKGKLTVGEGFIAPGFHGNNGARIDELGNAEMRSLTLRDSLTVPELRFNKITVIEGEQWHSAAHGTIKEVTVTGALTGTAELDLDESELATIAVGDICRGVYNALDDQSSPYRTGYDYDAEEDTKLPVVVDSDRQTDDCGLPVRVETDGSVALFYTCYFTITAITTNQRGRCVFTYALRTPAVDRTAPHPVAHMRFAQYGSFTDAERRACSFSTVIPHSYTLMLEGVSTWAISSTNIMLAQGWIDGLQLLKSDGETYLELDGTGLYAQRNVYFGQAVVDLDVAQLNNMIEAATSYAVSLSNPAESIEVDESGNVIGGLWTDSVVDGSTYRTYRLHTAVTVKRGNTPLVLVESNPTAGQYSMAASSEECTFSLSNGSVNITSISTPLERHEAKVTIVINAEGKDSVTVDFPVTIQHHKDGTIYLVETSVENVTIPADSNTGMLNGRASFKKRVGGGAAEDYSCFWAAYRRNGNTYTRFATAGLTKATYRVFNQVEVSSDPSDDTYAEAVVVFISDSTMMGSSFADAAPTDYLAKAEIAVVKQGDTGQPGANGSDGANGADGVSYRCKWTLGGTEVSLLSALYTGALKGSWPLVATLMKRVGGGAEEAVTASGSTMTVYCNGMHHNHTVGGQNPQLTVSTTANPTIATDLSSNTCTGLTVEFALNGGSTFTYSIQKVMDGASITGATGPIPIPYAEYNPASTYTRTDELTPYVWQYNSSLQQRQYFILIAKGEWKAGANNTHIWTPEGGTADNTRGASPYDEINAGKTPAVWKQITNFPYLMTEVLMAEMGTIGSWVFWGDYMFSGQGQGSLGQPEDAGGSYIPNLLLDAKTGAIKMRTGFFGGFLRSLPNIIHSGNIDTKTNTAALDNLNYCVTIGVNGVASKEQIGNFGEKFRVAKMEAIGARVILYATGENTGHEVAGYSQLDNVMIQLPFYKGTDANHGVDMRVGASGGINFEDYMKCVLGTEALAEEKRLEAESYVGCDIEIVNYNTTGVYMHGLHLANVYDPWDMVYLPENSIIRAKCVREGISETPYYSGNGDGQSPKVPTANFGQTAIIYWEVEYIILDQGSKRYLEATWNSLGLS